MGDTRNSLDSDGSERLASLLESYADRVRSGAAPREEAGVSVERRVGFQNYITAGSSHRFLIDEPENFGGGGQAADPAEVMLAAVGASLSVTLTAHAAMRGLTIDVLHIQLRSWMSAEEFLRPRDTAQAGLLDLVIDISMSSSIDQSDAEELLQLALAASPVVQSLRDPPTAKLHLKRPQ